MGKRGRPKKMDESIDAASQENTEVTEETQSEPVEKDPAYNCGECKGEGIVFTDVNPQGIICKNCHGTGKI